MSGLKFYQSHDEDENPMMYNWNFVHVKYCDSTSYAGDAVLKYKVSIITREYYWRHF
jgi:hypothetical protein